MSSYIMAIDAEKCINCKACIVACQQRNGVPYGLARNWVKEFSNSHAVLGQNFQPGACMHCDHPPCVDACPTRATFKAEDGSVCIDVQRCIGCGGCVEACPYGARYKHPQTGVADKCDYCRQTTQDQTPACVQVCPVHCRIFGDDSDPTDPVVAALASSTRVYVAPGNCDTSPTLTYLSATTPTDWPKSRPVPTALAVMGSAAMAVKYLGGLSLAGVICVFVKQLFFPSDPTNPVETKENGHD